MVKISFTTLYAILLALDAASATPTASSIGKERIQARNLAYKGFSTSDDRGDDQSPRKSLQRLSSVSPVPFRKSVADEISPPNAAIPGKGLKHYQEESKRLYPESAQRPFPETSGHPQFQQEHHGRGNPIPEDERQGHYQKQRLNQPFEKHETKEYAAREKLHSSPNLRKETARSEQAWHKANSESDAKQKAMDKQRQWNKQNRLPRSDKSFKQQELLDQVSKKRPKVRFNDEKNTVISS